MTKRQLRKIENRVEEINAAIELCGPNDDDVLANLDIELASLVYELEKEHKEALMRERIENYRNAPFDKPVFYIVG